MMTSTSEGFLLNQRTPAATEPGLDDPCIVAGYTSRLSRAAHYVDDVSDHRARRRCHNANTVWKRRQGAFAISVEEPLGKESGLELLKRELERTGSARLHGLGDELKLAAALVHGDASTHQHRKTIGRTKAKPDDERAQQEAGPRRPSG